MKYFPMFFIIKVCPALSLAHVGKILSRFSPDEFSPEPVTTELLDALSSEVSYRQHTCFSSLFFFSKLKKFMKV